MKINGAKRVFQDGNILLSAENACHVPRGSLILFSDSNVLL